MDMRLISETGNWLIRSRIGNRILRSKPGLFLATELGNLARRLPLSTPITIHIDPCNLCNFRCIFCPQGDLDLLKKVGRPKGFMDLELFKKAISDLAEFEDQVVVLSLYKDGEPLLNKNIAKMIQIAKEMKVAHIVDIATNGSLLNENMATAILNSRLDAITISVEQINSGGYKSITQVYSDYDSILRNVSYLYKLKNSCSSKINVKAKIILNLLSENEHKTFIKDFGPITDLVEINGLMGWSRSSLKDFTLGEKITTGIDGFSPLAKARKTCSLPFTSMAINFDGAVSVCCNDWSHGLIVGDIKNEKLIDIWNGEKLYNVRMLHISGKREDLNVCNDCQYILGMPPWTNLDNYQAQLIGYYKQSSSVN
jgi:MoaA/NifB/PqqE/SkfB family radical SAM enzyme